MHRWSYISAHLIGNTVVVPVHKHGRGTEQFFYSRWRCDPLSAFLMMDLPLDQSIVSQNEQLSCQGANC